MERQENLLEIVDKRLVALPLDNKPALDILLNLRLDFLFNRELLEMVVERLCERELILDKKRPGESPKFLGDKFFDDGFALVFNFHQGGLLGRLLELQVLDPLFEFTVRVVLFPFKRGVAGQFPVLYNANNLRTRQRDGISFQRLIPPVQLSLRIRTQPIQLQLRQLHNPPLTKISSSLAADSTLVLASISSSSSTFLINSIFSPTILSYTS